MPLDPKDFILPGNLIDTRQFSGVISGAISQAAASPSVALGATLDATAMLRGILHPSAALLGTTTFPPGYLGTAYASLATLRLPYDVLGATINAQPYASTMNMLASAGSIGASVRDMFASAVIAPAALTSITVPRGTAAFQFGVTDSLRIASNVASPYLASSAAVFALDTSYAKVLGTAGFAVGQMSTAALQVGAFQSTIVGMSASLRSTWDLMRGDAIFLTTATVPILRAPAVELYTATHAAAVFSLPPDEHPATDDEIEAILDDAVDEFESRLGSVHQGLVDVYRGGVEALQSRGTDWQRHVMVSFRELSTHILHILAPDEKILPSAKQSDLHNGKPTRRARLNFIFADMAGPTIAKFYEADMKAAIELFDLLNDGTHRLEQSAKAEQVHYIRGRVVGIITAMLEARGF